MALSLPLQVAGAAIPERDMILTVTYVVVVFSVLVQGLTMGTFARRWFAASSPGAMECLADSPAAID